MTKEQLKEALINITKLQQRQYYYTEDSFTFISNTYKHIKPLAKVISINDGQFTGGYSSELYEYEGKVYEFGFDPSDKLDSLTITPV